ncbi:MAG: Hemerythrin cation binding domain protein [Fibrobacteres bacterium]|nr:Hemerythrin cation binding domain protein [Fibrobacterota bacterium]
MDSMEKWLFPGTTLGTVLKVRPMAISILEKYGVNPWDPRYPTVGEMCRDKGISLDVFSAEIKSLPVPDRDTDWKRRPIFHLLDFLAHEHRQYLHGLLPAIRHSLAQEYQGDGESLRRLRYLVEEWPAFSAALAEHIHEEESFLFPKILHYEYCLKHKEEHPDFSNGSVNVYVAMQMLGNEKKQMAAVRRFLNEVKFSTAANGAAGCLEEHIEPLLEDLQSRLMAHAALETNELFPKAKFLEKALMDARIAGGSGGFRRPHLLSL